jgi:hypothetical protein
VKCLSWRHILVQYAYYAHWQCCEYCVVAGGIPIIVKWVPRKECEAIAQESNKPKHAYFVKEIQDLQMKTHDTMSDKGIPDDP